MTHTIQIILTALNYEYLDTDLIAVIAIIPSLMLIGVVYFETIKAISIKEFFNQKEK